MEAKLCEVCCNQYETGAILLDRRLRNTLERINVTGQGGMCKKCDKLHRDGYVAIVGVKNNPEIYTGHLKQEDADRTGSIAHLRKEAFLNIFNVEIPLKGMVFCDEEVIEKLQSMMHPEDKQ